LVRQYYAVSPYRGQKARSLASLSLSLPRRVANREPNVLEFGIRSVHIHIHMYIPNTLPWRGVYLSGEVDQLQASQEFASHFVCLDADNLFVRTSAAISWMCTPLRATHSSALPLRSDVSRCAQIFLEKWDFLRISELHFYRIGMQIQARLWKSSSLKNFFGCSFSLADSVNAIYSASVNDIATVRCFWDSQVSGYSPSTNACVWSAVFRIICPICVHVP